MYQAHLADGTLVREGDTVTSFRGEKATFVAVSRDPSPGKSGKVTVLWQDRDDYPARGEYYPSVFKLELRQAGTAEPVKRTLREIAADIRESWPKPYFGAAPYLDAMETLDSVDDDFGLDSGRYIVRYFLANAGTFRGADARRLKAELKALVSGARA